jgi:hypothetical protein
MRAFAIAADVAMGLILGAFLYAALTSTWPAVRGPVAVVAVLALSVLLVLFRRPNGSLARRSERP